MADTFNPQKYMTQISGRDYLPVAARIKWFRTDHPKGRIASTFVVAGEYLIAQASIYDGDGDLLAVGSATVRPYSPDRGKSQRDIEKAETAAIGRALAFAGYGTLEAGDEIDEGEHLADAPQEPRPAQSRKEANRVNTGANDKPNGWPPVAETISENAADDVLREDEADKVDPIIENRKPTGWPPAEDDATKNAPGAFIGRIMNDSTVQNTWKAPQEARATINKMWRDGELSADMDEADAILSVIERLKKHREAEQPEPERKVG